MAKQAKKKKNVQINPVGEAHVQASFNNIIISLCNENGQVISWSSAGKMGFRGSKKNTPYAAQTAAEDCAKTAQEAGLRKVKVFVKGPGNGRESAIRSLHNAGIEVMEIVDITPQPHNGCRPPKRRDILVQKQKLLENLASLSSEMINLSKKEITLRDNTETLDVEVKNRNMLSS